MRISPQISTKKSVYKVFISNLKSSQSVQVGVKPMSEFLEGINGSSIGNITVIKNLIDIYRDS